MGLVNQMQTTLQDASCHCSHQTMGKNWREKETIYKSLNYSSICMITQKDFVAVYRCRTFRSCVRYRPHITRSTYLSLYWTALAFRLAQFDITFQSQIHHVRELECLCTQITLIIITSNTLPVLDLFKLQMSDNKYSGKYLDLRRMA